MAAGLRALLVPVRADWYAIPLERVGEVLDELPVTRLPDAPGSLLGLVNVRGRVVPVLDLAVLLGLPPLAIAPQALAIARTARGPAGLAGTGVPVADTLGDDLGPSSLATGVRRHRTSSGVGTLLDLDATVAAERVGG
jgi:purine-binding chemotaxis protein CheW